MEGGIFFFNEVSRGPSETINAILTALDERVLTILFIAGAFGTYIDPLNAINIGMLPKVPINRIFQVGNAAGVGAKQVLLSKELRERAKSLAKDIKYIE